MRNPPAQETMDEIVEFLGADDRASLDNLALSSRALQNSVLRVRWRLVWVWGLSTHPDSIADFFTARPSIAVHVRTIRFRASLLMASHVDGLERLADCCTNANKIVLSKVNFVLHKDLISSFVPVLQKFRTIEFCRCVVTTSVFKALAEGASNIRELRFPCDNIAHVGNGTLSPNALVFFSSITSLLFAADGDDYDGTPMEYPWLASVKWSSLQDLYVKAHDDKGITSANDILVASPSVQHLVLHICPYERIDQGVKVDFSCMNSMKNLALTVDLRGVQMIAGSLSTLKGQVLRKVTINLYAAWNEVDNQDRSVIGQLDSALVRLIDPERFHGMVIGSYTMGDKYDKSRS
ncbi:uncharacterized protein ARMOST_06523 [Armillaria ostoyae]|uniref:F-box domain-containing protein n=1 Tax=Armillaria ostoyae TaxID=47428 RepID=A0A284R380_ARMOS|nr:uncharacterized protein ARMOST_06523 [Armillaria ostoyae]